MRARPVLRQLARGGVKRVSLCESPVDEPKSSEPARRAPDRRRRDVARTGSSRRPMPTEQAYAALSSVATSARKPIATRTRSAIPTPRAIPRRGSRPGRAAPVRTPPARRPRALDAARDRGEHDLEGAVAAPVQRFEVRLQPAHAHLGAIVEESFSRRRAPVGARTTRDVSPTARCSG